MASVLVDVERFLGDFHLLENASRLFPIHKPSTATWTVAKPIVVNSIHLIGGKRGTFVTRMARLSTTLPSLAFRRSVSRWPHYVARRRLRRGRGVLLCLRQEFLKPFDPRLQLGVLGFELSVPCFQPRGLAALPGSLAALSIGPVSLHTEGIGPVTSRLYRKIPKIRERLLSL